MMSDASKASVWSAVWQPFGGLHSLSGTLSSEQRFPGQWFQLESGLSYNWHRHYDASTGRYTQPDPLGLVDGSSVYAYAGGSPYMYVDPDGRLVIQVGVGGTAQVGLGGGDVSGGIYADFSTGNGGYFHSSGISNGVNVSADIFAGFMTGSTCDFEGTGRSITISGPLASITYLETKSGQWGLSIGIGPTLTLFGLSIAPMTQTNVSRIFNDKVDKCGCQSK